jgi:hypothetical protein
MRPRWLIVFLMLLGGMGATIRYDMSKDEVLKELGKPTSILVRGNREILMYPGGVRIEMEQGKVASVKGIDLAAAEQAAAAPATPPADAKPTEATPEEDDEEADDPKAPKLTPEQQKAADEAEAKLEKEMAEANAKARAELEKAITDLENLSSQPEREYEPSFDVGDFLIGLFVKWLLMLAALKLTAKYWAVDIEWKGLMIAAAADTAVRAVVLGIGEGLLGMFTVFYADEALAAIVLVVVLRKVSTNQSLQQAVTITLTSKVFSIVVGSFVTVAILNALH